MSLVKRTSERISERDYVVEERGSTRRRSPLLLGDKEGLDGEITPDDIYKFFAETKTTPKTSAITPEKYYEFFAAQTADGSEVVHFTISSKMSSCYSNACKAAEQCGGVYVVDSQNLSTGAGLLVLYADDLAKEGLGGREIKARVDARRSAVQASFVVDTMTFLYRGGRCSGVAAFVASVLKIKPSIFVKNGEMGVGKKYMGATDKAIVKYVADTLKTYDRPDLKYVFVTHTSARPEVVEIVKKEVLDAYPDAHIYETIAGATVTSHCGKGTLGVLYFNDK